MNETVYPLWFLVVFVATATGYEFTAHMITFALIVCGIADLVKLWKAKK